MSTRYFVNATELPPASELCISLVQHIGSRDPSARVEGVRGWARKWFGARAEVTAYRVELDKFDVVVPTRQVGADGLPDLQVHTFGGENTTVRIWVAGVATASPRDPVDRLEGRPCRAGHRMGKQCPLCSMESVVEASVLARRLVP